MISMPATLTTSTPLSASFRPNSYVRPISERESNGQKDSQQERFNSLRAWYRSIDYRNDPEPDPYKRFVALCREFHGHRTKRGHSFHARKLRWLWYHSDGKNGTFENLWNSMDTQRTRDRNDELGIAVRCLAGGFTPGETEAVIKGWWKHHGEGSGFMSIHLFRAITLTRAMEVTAEIRQERQGKMAEKYWSKTANRILWVLEESGETGATPKTIAEEIDRSVETVKHRLKRLCKAGEVEKIRRGVYRRVGESEAEIVELPVAFVETEVAVYDQPDPDAAAGPGYVNGGETKDTVEDLRGNELPFIDIREETCQEKFMELVLNLSDKDRAEVKIRERFYRQAEAFANNRGPSPKHLDYQLQEFRSRWEERHEKPAICHGADR